MAEKAVLVKLNIKYSISMMGLKYRNTEIYFLRVR